MNSNIIRLNTCFSDKSSACKKAFELSYIFSNHLWWFLMIKAWKNRIRDKDRVHKCVFFGKTVSYIKNSICSFTNFEFRIYDFFTNICYIHIRVSSNWGKFLEKTCESNWWKHLMNWLLLQKCDFRKQYFSHLEVSIILFLQFFG